MMSTAKSKLKPYPPVDEFSLRAGGIDPAAPRQPQHPGFTRRELESLVSGGSLHQFGLTRSWRESLLVLAVLLVCVLAVAGAVWTFRVLWSLLMTHG